MHKTPVFRLKKYFFNWVLLKFKRIFGIKYFLYFLTPVLIQSETIYWKEQIQYFIFYKKNVKSDFSKSNNFKFLLFSVHALLHHFYIILTQSKSIKNFKWFLINNSFWNILLEIGLGFLKPVFLLPSISVYTEIIKYPITITILLFYFINVGVLCFLSAVIQRFKWTIFSIYSRAILETIWKISLYFFHIFFHSIFSSNFIFFLSCSNTFNCIS